MMRRIATLADQVEQSGQRGVFAVNTSNDQMDFVRDGTKRGNNLDRTAFRDRLFNGLRDEFARAGNDPRTAADLAKQLLGSAKIAKPVTDQNGNISRSAYSAKAVRYDQLGSVLANARHHLSQINNLQAQNQIPVQQNSHPNLSQDVATDINYNPHQSSNLSNPLIQQSIKSTHLKPRIQHQQMSQDVATNVSYNPKANSASNVPSSKNQPMTQQELQQIVNAAGVTPGAFPLQHPSQNLNHSSSEDDSMYDLNGGSSSEDDSMFDPNGGQENTFTPMGVTPDGGKLSQQHGKNAPQQNGDAELQIEIGARPVQVENQYNRKGTDSDEDIWDGPIDRQNEPPLQFAAIGNTPLPRYKQGGDNLRNVVEDPGNQNDEGIEESSDSAPLLSADEDGQNDDEAGPIVSNITAGNDVEDSESWQDDVDPNQGNTPQ